MTEECTNVITLVEYIKLLNLVTTNAELAKLYDNFMIIKKLSKNESAPGSNWNTTFNVEVSYSNIDGKFEVHGEWPSADNINLMIEYNEFMDALNTNTILRKEFDAIIPFIKQDIT